MDIDATLKEIRAICRAKDGDYDDAERLAELFRSLDRWIVSGGYLPKAWKRA